MRLPHLVAGIATLSLAGPAAHVIINVVYNPAGKSSVSHNSHLPLADRPVPPPAIEHFDTPDEALVRAKQLEAEAGGPDVARIIEHPARLDQLRARVRRVGSVA